MPDPASPPDLFRFTCPHCQKVLKARIAWAGRSGICPGCKTSVKFPEYTPPSAKSRTAQQLLLLVAEDDNITFDDDDAENFPCSCPRQRAVISAWRESFSTNARSPLAMAPPPEFRRRAASPCALASNNSSNASRRFPTMRKSPQRLLVASESANPDAWKVITRFLYYLRHDACEKCQTDPTGLSCIYLTFDAFLQARQVSPELADNWQKISHHHLGL